MSLPGGCPIRLVSTFDAYGPYIRRALNFSASWGIDSIHLHKDRAAARVRAAIGRSRLSFSVCTVDDPEEIKDLLNVGAVLLITDNVDVAIALANC